MPDFNIETYYHCNSAQCFSTKVMGSKEYTVSFSETLRGPYQYDYSCTCDAFKFGKCKYCKHIEEVKKSGKHCGWMQFIHGDKPIEQDGHKFCPKCGDEVSIERVAV